MGEYRRPDLHVALLRVHQLLDDFTQSLTHAQVGGARRRKAGLLDVRVPGDVGLCRSAFWEGVVQREDLVHVLMGDRVRPECATVMTEPTKKKRRRLKQRRKQRNISAALSSTLTEDGALTAL